jgi:hypothetical protein
LLAVVVVVMDLDHNHLVAVEQVELSTNQQYLLVQKHCIAFKLVLAVLDIK